MTTLERATSVDTSKMTRIEPPRPQFPAVPDMLQQPGLNAFLRCPMPPITVTPDTLRQFYRGGQVPQARVLTPFTQVGGAASSGSSSSSVTVVTGGSSSSSSDSDTDDDSPAPVNASITTTEIGLGFPYTGTIELAESFDVLQVGVSDTCRVRLYATENAQLADLTRDNNTAPTAGAQHGVIFDLYLDTVDKLSWLMSPIAPGANGDTPQSSTLYITVDPLAYATEAYTVTILYEAS